MHLKFGGGRTSVTDTLDGEKSTQSMQTRLYSVVLAVVRYSERKGTIVEDDIACCKKNTITVSLCVLYFQSA